MKKVLIEEMTWVEFEEAMKDNDLVIVPVGSTEEHGVHGPLGSDTLVAEACAKAIGEGAQVPVAGAFPFGYAAGLMGFPGTISLDPDLLRKVYFAYAESYVKHGAKRFLFINGHGGNTDVLANVAADLYEKYGCISMHTQWWNTLPELNKEWPCNDHGGYFETSMTMAVNEEIVDMSKAKSAPTNDLTTGIKSDGGWKYKGASIPLPIDLYRTQKIGNVGGEPFKANAELGKAMTAAYVEYNIALAKEMKKIKLENF